MSDLYKDIAARLFNVNVSSVTPEQRDAARNVAFPYLYNFKGEEYSVLDLNQLLARIPRQPHFNEGINDPTLELVAVYTTHRTINYFGRDFHIPYDHDFVAMDEDGAVNSFNKKPSYYGPEHRGKGEWLCMQPTNTHEIARLVIGDVDPSKTLRYYPV